MTGQLAQQQGTGDHLGQPGEAPDPARLELGAAGHVGPQVGDVERHGHEGEHDREDGKQRPGPALAGGGRGGGGLRGHRRHRRKPGVPLSRGSQSRPVRDTVRDPIADSGHCGPGTPDPDCGARRCTGRRGTPQGEPP